MATTKKQATKKQAAAPKAKAPVKAAAKAPTKKVGTAKKTAPKKTATARRTKKSTCSCTVTCVPEQAFWVNYGPVVTSVAELKQALRSMSDDQFAYHALRDGNDFARWMRDCLDDAERALQLEKAKTRAAAIKALQVCCD